MPRYRFILDEQRATEEQKGNYPGEMKVIESIYGMLRELEYRVDKDRSSRVLVVSPTILESDIRVLEERLGYPLRVQKI